MTTRSIVAPLWWTLLSLAPAASAQTVEQLTPHNVKVESVEYQGKRTEGYLTGLEIKAQP